MLRTSKDFSIDYVHGCAKLEMIA